MYSAIDMVSDKLEKQIKKGKEKIRDHRTAARAKAKDIMSTASIAADEDLGQEIRVKNIEYKPMDS